MGWEVLSEGTPLLTPASVSKIVSGINNVLAYWLLNHLPNEIISNILLKLPLKYLVRCTSVCKSLGAFIKHPTFMLNHLTHNRKINDHNSTHLMLLHLMFHEGPGYDTPNYNIQDNRGDAYSLQYDNQGFDEYCQVEPPAGLNRIKVMDSFTIVGSCNGLICLADDMGMFDANFALWNPSVRRYIRLPKPSIRFSKHNVYESTVGVGYDVKSNDYKIVRVVTLLQQTGFPTVAQVYSLARGTWSEVSTDLPPCSIALRPLKEPGKGKVNHVRFGLMGNMGQAFVNGVVNLIALRQIGDANNYFVLTFDVNSEAFGEIMFPKRYEPEDQLDLRFSATGDEKSIALFVKNMSHECLDIWVMKEYGVQNSWTKLMILTSLGPDRILHGAVCFRKSGELLSALEDRGELYSLDIMRKQFQLLGTYKYKLSFCTAYSYEESLVLLDRKDATSY